MLFLVFVKFWERHFDEAVDEIAGFLCFFSQLLGAQAHLFVHFFEPGIDKVPVEHQVEVSVQRVERPSRVAGEFRKIVVRQLIKQLQHRDKLLARGAVPTKCAIVTKPQTRCPIKVNDDIFVFEHLLVEEFPDSVVLILGVPVDPHIVIDVAVKDKLGNVLREIFPLDFLNPIRDDHLRWRNSFCHKIK